MLSCVVRRAALRARVAAAPRRRAMGGGGAHCAQTAAAEAAVTSERAAALIARESRAAAHNYHPLPVVLSRGEGVHVWDVDDKRYFDFLSAYSSVNQGHCHPRVQAAMVAQASRLTLTSRAFHNDTFAEYAEYITSLLGYDKVLPMNSGVEGVETAVKLARKWAYEVKGVAPNDAVVVWCTDNFHGRSLSAVSASTDPDAYGNFGPFVPNYVHVPFNDAQALRDVLAEHGHRVAAFIVEPIQGEAGVVVPDDGYLRDVRAACDAAKVLFVADEVQSGLGRTGTLLATHHDALRDDGAAASAPGCGAQCECAARRAMRGVRPDMVVLGKALSGGFLPVSAVLADDAVMLRIRPGQHGSTFGGYPLANTVAKAALEVLVEERLCDAARERGEQLRAGLRALRSPLIDEVRGRGLLNAVVVRHEHDNAAWLICLEMARNGLLAKPTHGDKIRLAPPLTISEAQVDECVSIIGAALKKFE